MATKKQKRVEGLARREQFLREEKERGLLALASARKVAEERRKANALAAMELNERYRQILSSNGVKKAVEIVQRYDAINAAKA